MTAIQGGYFGLESGSEAEATAVAQHVSKESDRRWIVSELTYPDRVVHVAVTATAFERGNPSIPRRAVRAFEKGVEVSVK